MNSIRQWLSRTWLLGTLCKVGRPAYASAFYEFIYLFLWSVLPFALGALVLYVVSDASSKNIFQLGVSTFKNGELLVFTISMLAPILYLTLHDPEQAAPFPHKLPISTVVALVIVTCAALFALLKASAVKDSSFVFELSVWLTALALAFRYLALVYHRFRMPPISEIELRADQESYKEDFRTLVEENLKSEERSFVTQLQNHLGEQA
ncbi:hypothetical protein [Polaromonas sp. LjRoot131]|uniref:hypothetical protein n=1 Tax=Polaromonas sp. LjRoot131 TaxID=3342262 RepID=UPI003ED1012B